MCVFLFVAYCAMLYDMLLCVLLLCVFVCFFSHVCEYVGGAILCDVVRLVCCCVCVLA